MANIYLVTLKILYFDGMSNEDEILSTSFYEGKTKEEAEEKAVKEAESLDGARRHPTVLRSMLWRQG